MRKSTRILGAISMTMVISLVLPKVPEWISDLSHFQVAEVEIQGNRYLSAAQVLEAARVSPSASLWDDRMPILARLLDHPAIREARVVRHLPARLVIQVVEREPVALIPNPTLVPVDVDGMLLPIDPVAHRLDLPLLHPRIHPQRDPAGDGTPLTALQLRTLVAEVKRMGESNPDVLASVSDLGMDPWGDVLMRLENGVLLHYRTPLSPRRLQEGLHVLADAVERNPGRTPAEIDLRFADQVVVRLAPSNGS